MSCLYRNITRELLPGAAIIVDHWHVSRMHEKHFSKWTKSKKLPYRQALYKIRICPNEEAQNSDAAMLEDTTTSRLMTEKRIRSVILGRFYLIYQAADRKQAEERLEAWRAMIEHHNLTGFKKLVECTYQWKEEILAYFDFERKYTAAFTESANGIMKAKYLAGRGYSFDFIRKWAMVRSPSCQRPVSVKRKKKDERRRRIIGRRISWRYKTLRQDRRVMPERGSDLHIIL
jgi:hypothetical protein